MAKESYGRGHSVERKLCGENGLDVTELCGRVDRAVSQRYAVKRADKRELSEIFRVRDGQVLSRPLDCFTRVGVEIAKRKPPYGGVVMIACDAGEVHFAHATQAFFRFRAVANDIADAKHAV